MKNKVSWGLVKNQELKVLIKSYFLEFPFQSVLSYSRKINSLPGKNVNFIKISNGLFFIIALTTKNL